MVSDSAGANADVLDRVAVRLLREDERAQIKQHLAKEPNRTGPKAGILMDILRVAR
jgi:hypothetical protein